MSLLLDLWTVLAVGAGVFFFSLAQLAFCVFPIR